MADDARDHERGTPRRPGFVAVLVIGAALRLLLVVGAPRFGYAWDHFDIIGMGVVAGGRGLTHVYSASPTELPLLRGWVVQNGRPVMVQRRCVHPPNYPPLSQVVFWLQSWWLDAGDPAFVVNTAYTRVVTSLAPWIFELLTALGVGWLTRALTGAPHLAAAAGAAMWLAPPLMMNTGLFAQYDALALAPAVFAVLAMLGGQWLRAGICVGLGLLAKPQGLLMVPIAAFAALAAAPRELPAVSHRLAVVGSAALVTILIGSAPWMLADGFAWVQRCYRMNLFEVLPYTTLEAFNVWYLLGLVAERQPVFDVLASTTTVAGLARDAWGRLLLAGALGATAALCWWRERDRPGLAIALFAGLALWAVFMWPTRVHERYLLYCIPFMVAAAAAVPRLRPIVAALLLVATMEHSWMVWRSGPPLGSFDRRTAERFHEQRFQAYWQGRPVTIEGAKAGPKPEESRQLAFARHRSDRHRSDALEWALTLLSLGAYAAAIAVAAGHAPATLASSDDDAPVDPVIASA
jgi:hypothetical protein